MSRSDRLFAGILALLVLVALATYAFGPKWESAGRLRRQVIARNEAFDLARKRGLPPQDIPDGLSDGDVINGCTPIEGVVDKAACDIETRVNQRTYGPSNDPATFMAAHPAVAEKSDPATQPYGVARDDTQQAVTR